MWPRCPPRASRLHSGRHRAIGYRRRAIADRRRLARSARGARPCVGSPSVPAGTPRTLVAAASSGFSTGRRAPGSPAGSARSFPCGRACCTLVRTEAIYQEPPAICSRRAGSCRGSLLRRPAPAAYPAAGTDSDPHGAAPAGRSWMRCRSAIARRRWPIARCPAAAEADLLAGGHHSRIAALVERQSRFTPLVKARRRGARTPPAIVPAVARQMRTLPTASAPILARAPTAASSWRRTPRSPRRTDVQVYSSAVRRTPLRQRGADDGGHGRSRCNAFST